VTDTAMLPESWRGVLGEELQRPYFKELTEFVEEERAKGPVYPPREEVFAALDATPYERVKVLILGQDPYHGEGQGHGLCFSVRPGVKTPPSLRNIYKEMKEELGTPIPDNGYLMPWAEQGVLLLNAVLTVRSGEANSHKGKGWEKFTDAVIRAADRREAARRGEGRAPLAAVREEVLRLAPVHADQRGGGRAGPRPDRLDHPEPGLTAPHRPWGREPTRSPSPSPAWPSGVRSRLTVIVSGGR